MTVEIVRVTTPDGVRLDGAFQPAESRPPEAIPIDSALLWHGTGASFYSSTLLDTVAGELRTAGVATLVANTRGHDLAYIAATSTGPRRLGAAYEVVDDCRHDLQAWTALLRTRGFKRVGLFGHSLGGIKAIYALSHNDRPDVVARLCAISPARLSHRRFSKGPNAQEFSSLIQTAETHVREGHPDAILDVKIPIPYLVTAAGYLDKYGPAERYNILDLLPRVSLSALVTLGTVEVESHEAFRGLPEDVEAIAKSNRHLKLAVLAGADHNYAGVRTELCARILSWLRGEKEAGKKAAKSKAAPAKSDRRKTGASSAGKKTPARGAKVARKPAKKRTKGR